MSKTYYLGIDIGGTKCAVIAGSSDMEIFARRQFATKSAQNPSEAISRLIELGQEMIDDYNNMNLEAIGICCGGPLDSTRGVILSPPNLPLWDEIEIVSIFEERFGVPVYLQNDANACALAEYRFGAGRGVKNMIFLTFGTGLGAGLILDGRLYSGTNDLAGEVGHLRLAQDGPMGYGKRGSFEGFCSGAGIANMALKIIQNCFDKGQEVSFISEHELDSITTKIIADAAVRGDEVALEIFRESGKYLGMGLSILIDILNPELIVIGGVYARHPTLFKETCDRMIAKEALMGASAVCQVVPALLGEKVGDYASLSVAMIEDLRTPVSE